jgi:rubrerythrin
MGFLANWIIRRVVKSALVFEASSMETYRRLGDRLVDDPLWDSLGHLLAEEEHHWRILSEAAAGRLDAAEVERVVRDDLYGNLGRMSRIPVVRRAFEVVAAREREHVQILRRLLAAPTGAAATPVVDIALPGE